MNCKISELCDINKNSLKKGDNIEFINYLDTSNLTEGKIDEIVLLNPIEDKIPSRAKRIPKQDDILYSTVRPYQLHYGFIDKPIENLICSTGFAVLSPNGKVNPYYLYKYLTQRNIIEYLQGVAETSTSAYPSIKPSDIADLEIELPTLEVQESIANILSSLDDKIELNNKINKNLEEMAQALYKQWFVDFEFPNENGEPYKSTGGEMIESELGFIPKGWGVVDFSDIMMISSGKRPPAKVKEKDFENNIPVLGASGIMAYTNVYNIMDEVLVIGRVGTHGIIQRINKNVWSSDNTLVIRSDKYYYSYHILFGIDYKALNRGSTQPLITQTDIKRTLIIKPDVDVLEMFENQCRGLFDEVNRNNQESITLAKIRDTLLPKLMSGEIEVPNKE